MLRSRSVLLCALLALAAGCGEEKMQMYEVEGTVTLNGEPLDRIAVDFWPQSGGPRSTGITDANGRFVLSTYGTEKEQKGAVADTHKVALRDNSVFAEGIEKLSAAEMRARDDLVVGKSRIHSKYSNAMQTPLQVTISSEKKDLNFEVDPPEG